MRSLITLALMGISSVALAAAPDWKGYAGLADKDGDGYPAFIGTSTAASTGYSGVVDCDDKHSNRNPGLTEIPGDDIDQDCNGSDLVLKVSKAEWGRFVKSGQAKDKKEVVFAKEYDRCVAATGRCSVDANDGKFIVTDPDVDAFSDIYIGTGKRLGTDGIREVVTLEEASHFRGGSSSSGGGVSTRTVTKIAKIAVEKEREERLGWQAEFESGVITPLTDAVNEHTEAIVAGVEALEAEAVARESADTAEAKIRHEEDLELQKHIIAAKKDADRAIAMADSVASHGPLIDGYVVNGLAVGASVSDDGGTARNAVGVGIGGGINVGADIESGRVNAFVDAMIGADGGAGPAHSEAVGIEIVGGHHVGGFLAYSQRSSQPNALETQVLGRNPLVGASYVLTFAQNGAKHGLLQVRAGCGPEFIGMSGDSVTDGVGIGCRATVGIGGGIGALQ